MIWGAYWNVAGLKQARSFRTIVARWAVAKSFVGDVSGDVTLDAIAKVGVAELTIVQYFETWQSSRQLF